VPLVEALLQQFFQAWYHKPYKQPHAASAKLLLKLIHIAKQSATSQPGLSVKYRIR